MNLRDKLRYMNPYDVHRSLINEYMLKRPGDTKLLHLRDASKDRTDLDVIREHHKFLWNEHEDGKLTWEQEFAKKYYDKLFKEYCITDLTFYKQNKIAMRWRVEKEVVLGKGQFICGNKQCQSDADLRTWEVNFAYVEDREKKNALVKLRLCPECSLKLNYHSKKKEIKRNKMTKSRIKKKRKSDSKHEDDPTRAGTSNVSQEGDPELEEENKDNIEDEKMEESPWEKQTSIDAKTREEEMDDYLQELLF